MAMTSSAGLLRTSVTAVLETGADAPGGATGTQVAVPMVTGVTMTMSPTGKKNVARASSPEYASVRSPLAENGTPRPPFRVEVRLNVPTRSLPTFGPVATMLQSVQPKSVTEVVRVFAVPSIATVPARSQRAWLIWNESHSEAVGWAVVLWKLKVTGKAKSCDGGPTR